MSRAGFSQSPLSQDEWYALATAVEQYAGRSSLLGGEEAILERLRPRLHGGATVLDVGVGGGRTTLHLAPLAGRYVGVDLSAGMVEECRRRFAGAAAPALSHAVFQTADARAMPEFADGSFDVVWFTYNGIDTVGGAPEREQSLGELVRICAPGGVVAFSSHNIAAAGRFRRPGLSPRFPLLLRQELRDVREMRRLNPDLESARAAGGGPLRDIRPSGHLVETFFVRPDVQIRRLRELGLEAPAAVTEAGTWCTDEAELLDLREPYIHYWAVKPF